MRFACFGLPTVAAAAALAAAPAGAQVDLNKITKIEVQDAGDSYTVSVKGTKPPNFTTFSMADPSRFVIDFSESAFQGVPEDITVNNGLITIIKNLSYGSEATSIARVMIAFSKDVEGPDVQTNGETLIVKEG